MLHSWHIMFWLKFRWFVLQYCFRNRHVVFVVVGNQHVVLVVVPGLRIAFDDFRYFVFIADVSSIDGRQ